MPPKIKGKKGKKQDDDEYWENAGSSKGGIDLTDDGVVDESTQNPKSSAFAALGVDLADVGMEDEEDFGGLMAAIQKSSGKGKKDKKKKKSGFDALADDEDQSVSVADGVKPGQGSDTEAANAKGDISAPKKATTMTAEELADEEWGPVKTKGGKKKGKKAKGKADADEDEDIDETVEAEAVPAADSQTPKGAVQVTAGDLPDEEFGPAKEKGKNGKKDIPTSEKIEEEGEKADDDEGETDGKVLSKKEKEKLKKEREKARKKAQAAAKKAATAEVELTGGTPTTPVPAAANINADAPDNGEEEEEGEEGAAGTKSDKKKKKKKAAKKEEEPAPAKKKGDKSIPSALKAIIEERKRAEEQARQAEEERRRKVEEEERLAEEEAKRIEAEKQRKKEKEKLKREQAKKEGRLLTQKQKKDRQAAEIRRQALLASGVQIEGLQGQAAPSKKPIYGKKKPKGKDETSTQASTPEVQSPAVSVQELPPLTPELGSVAPPTSTAPDGVKESWDAGSDAEEPPVTPAHVADVRSDWDATSSDEDDAPSASPSTLKAPISQAIRAAKHANGTAKPAEASKGRTPAPAKAAASDATSTESRPATKKSVAEDDSESESSEVESSDEDSDIDSGSSEESSSDEEMTNAQRLVAQRKAVAAERRAKAHEAALAARNKDDLRSPICCILGHVDTGKTKLLDKIRQTNVQEGEAGGITQQIGATYFPVDAIITKTLVLNKDGKQEYKIPGLLIIDTPGHESFTNLRSRGSSLCNIAILVVDIMHGLEPQTLESLRLLRDRKTPFIVALNKIDRIYGWVPTPDGAFRETLAKQKDHVQRSFADMTQKIVVAFAEQGLNAILYYDNTNFGRNVSIVPTSAITGEGVPDMIMLLVNLTQQRMSERLMYLSELECTVLEVKVIEGLGTTIDVVLSNGILREGEKIVVCGLNGPIVTQIRALLTPQPLRELRIKSQYVHHKEVKAALGVKIAAPDLDKAIAGSRLLIVGPDDDEDELRDEVMSDLTTLLNSIDKSGKGVCVQASTLGSLEALLDFLKVSKIPVSGINIGPVHKKDVMRCATVLEKAKELACILCFDVTVDRDAERLADELGIQLFKADIIYHLFDAFTKYNNEIMEAKRRDAAPQAVWPCRLKIIACFAKRDPIILGVDILDGTLRVGTPLCVVKYEPPAPGMQPTRTIVDLGKITSLEINHKSMDVVKKSQAGGGVAVKIEHAVYQSTKMYGRHFDDKDDVISHITRTSIDVMKSTFRNDVSMDEWHLIKKLKDRLGVQ